MVCNRCHGQHWVIRSGHMAPCPECGGLGEVHCCEGLVEQPDYAEFACAVPVSSPTTDETTVLFRPAMR